MRLFDDWNIYTHRTILGLYTRYTRFAGFPRLNHRIVVHNPDYKWTVGVYKMGKDKPLSEYRAKNLREAHEIAHREVEKIEQLTPSLG